MLLAVGDGRAFPGKLGYAKRKIARRGAGVYCGEWLKCHVFLRFSRSKIRHPLLIAFVYMFRLLLTLMTTIGTETRNEDKNKDVPVWMI